MNLGNFHRLSSINITSSGAMFHCSTIRRTDADFGPQLISSGKSLS